MTVVERKQVLLAALADSRICKRGVDTDVVISDIGVVKSDVPSNAPRPRRRVPGPAPVPGVAPLADARGRSRAELERDLEDTIRRGKAAIVLSPGDDGTPAISSMIAVWVLTQVGKAVGTNRSPVKLSKVENPEDLRSIGGVARLLHAAFHPASAVAS